MKAGLIAASAASLLGSAAAAAGHARHQAMHMRRGAYGYGSASAPAYPYGTGAPIATGVEYEEVCSVYTTTVYGEATLVPAPPPKETSTPIVYVTPSPIKPYPTADVTTCPTPGTYTFPAKTTVVTETTTVCGATTTALPSGTHTYGGVTTSVVTATTVTCPYATVKTSGTIVTSVVETTTFVCPSAGEYTIAPSSTYVSTSTVIVYPVPSVFTPGTYTQPAKTVTAVETSYVYVCPYETVPAPQPTKEAEKPKETYPAGPSKEAEKPKETYVAPAPSKPAYTKPVESKPSSSPSYGGSGRVVTKGEKWAITYTPYTPSGQCRSKGEVESDIAEIAKLGFTTIRSYSTDCGVFENVVPACNAHGLKVILGIFFEAGGKGPFSEYANKQLQEIKNGAPKDSLVMVIVGNESIFNGICSAEELASYIDYVRNELHGAGFPKDIAITTTEPVDVWENKGAPLCSHIDVFTCQVHPFFTSTVSASEAGKFAASQLAQAAKVCPEAAAKGKYITEIGWPSAGQANGAAIPGKAQQKEAIKNILATVGTEAVLFSYQNDQWKPDGAFGVEKYWGCSDVL